MSLFSIFHSNEKIQEIPYDPQIEKPVIRCSICTGEKTAGFKNLTNGHFREYVLIRNEQELEDFKKGCKVENIENIY